MRICKGDIFWADLGMGYGSEQGGCRPVVILQNDTGNYFSSTVIAAVTSTHKQPDFPTHVKVNDLSCGLDRPSTILLEQIRTIDKTRLERKIGHIDHKTLALVDEAILASFGIINKNL